MIPQHLTNQNNLQQGSYYFSYYDDTGARTFYSRMFSGQCSYFKKDGDRCKRRCIVPFEYCHSHIQPVFNISVKQSTIPNAGKGLFADNGTNNNDIVFHKNDTILEYYGEFLNRNQLYNRYGDQTAPYAISLNNNRFLDGALLRATASIANTRRGNNNSNFVVSNVHNTIKIRANKNIRNKDEIFVSYGRAYKFPDEEHYDYKIRTYPTQN